MPLHDFASQRLFVEDDLEIGTLIALDRDKSHYLLRVLRMKEGETILVFNGRSGEWLAKISVSTRKSCSLEILRQTRPQPTTDEVWYAFAPLKSARLDYLVQKAVEMGVTRLMPVITRRTQATRLNEGRLRANAIEAAEQCGILALPSIEPETKFAAFIASWRKAGNATLVFCDEDADLANPVEALKALPHGATAVCVIIGPEGGFDPEERAALLDLPNAIRISLGPRILRADTAAVAALALVQATLGDWR